MNPENEIVIKDIVGSIRKLVRAVYLDSQKMSRQFGLTGPQSVVLRLLLNNGAMSSAELSRSMYVTPSNMTGIIDRLERKTLVKRAGKEGDRRVALIILTDTGKELSERIPDPIEKKFVKKLADLENEHVQILATAMNQILNLIDVSGIEETPLELSHESVSSGQERPPKENIGK
ncbi:MAG: MarR family transcriptional regulator [Desulfobacterales bacterium]|nr:MAG: MarR family transcriptional regulator [Desulfobacterales bacterium]